MGNLQYIGARYVPKFYVNPDDGSNDWKADDYEALEIVTYMNDSYTSRKPVDATIGNPADNPDYWVCTTKYTAAIMALQSAVGDLNDSVDNINTVLESTVNNGLSIETIQAFNYANYFTNIVGDTTHTAMQGAAYNSRLNKFIVAFVNSDDSSCVLVELDMDGLTVSRRKTFSNGELGHANDLTYNPVTNKYYVAICPSGATDNKLAEIDATSLIITDTIQLSPLSPTGDYVNTCVAYDAVNDRYVTMSAKRIQLYDDAFNLTEEIAIDTHSLLVNGSNSYTLVQCIDVRGDVLTMMLFKTNNNNIEGCTLCDYSLKNKTIITTWNKPVTTGKSEAEGMFRTSDFLYIISGGVPYYALEKVVFQTQPSLLTGADVFNQSITVLPNSDLDDIFIVGKYCISNVDAPTIAHAYDPVHSSTLFVFSTDEDHITQLFIPTADGFGGAMRKFIIGSDQWGPWMPFGRLQRGCPVIPVRNVCVPCYVTGGAKNLTFTLPIGDTRDLDLTNCSISGSIVCRYEGNYLGDGVNANEIKFENCNVTFASSAFGLICGVTRLDDGAFTGTNNVSMTGFTFIDFTPA